MTGIHEPAAEARTPDLQEHAAREDALMYRWAKRNLDSEQQGAIRLRLWDALRRLPTIRPIERPDPRAAEDEVH
jgi:hypothetical protein